MNDSKPQVDVILRRLSEVLDVLKKISEDLEDISKSLRSVTPRGTPAVATPAVATPAVATPAVATPAVATPAVATTLLNPPSKLATTTESKRVGRGVEDIRMIFKKELEELLSFEDKGDFIRVKPRQYLGSDNFAKIASTIREAGGEYVSAGRDSHFRIPK